MGANDAKEMLEVAKAECVRLERERDAALAVIEKARAEATHLFGVSDESGSLGARLHAILVSVDTSALAARDAEKWDETWQSFLDWRARDECAAYSGNSEPAPVNPYRALAEKGADRG